MQDLTVYNIIIGLLMVMFGFLLNRVFSQLDGHTKLISDLQSLLPRDFIEKAEFIRHADQEMRLMENLRKDFKERFDKIDSLLEVLRERQDTRTDG